MTDRLNEIRKLVTGPWTAEIVDDSNYRNVARLLGNGVEIDVTGGPGFRWYPKGTKGMVSFNRSSSFALYRFTPNQE